ncbi:SapB/AmfS family lanthipeptide [Streptomyces olivaceus]|uniref:SapB/AmfS family lanthipeptide n=1 Tax=Streptomyces olivaceus TaxID=47716 RepID=UPI0038139FAE
MNLFDLQSLETPKEEAMGDVETGSRASLLFGGYPSRCDTTCTSRLGGPGGGPPAHRTVGAPASWPGRRCGASTPPCAEPTGRSSGWWTPLRSGDGAGARDPAAPAPIPAGSPNCWCWSAR